MWITGDERASRGRGCVTDCAAWVLAVGMALADALAVVAGMVTAYELVRARVTTSSFPPDSLAGNDPGTTGARQAPRQGCQFGKSAATSDGVMSFRVVDGAEVFVCQIDSADRKHDH
jgi:hypothetical protein